MWLQATEKRSSLVAEARVTVMSRRSWNLKAAVSGEFDRIGFAYFNLKNRGNRHEGS